MYFVFVSLTSLLIFGTVSSKSDVTVKLEEKTNSVLKNKIEIDENGLKVEVTKDNVADNIEILPKVAGPLPLDGELPVEKEEFRPVKLPTDFKVYDLNQNGFISLEELVNKTGAMENAEEAFNATDTDADGQLSESEFDHAPWMLSAGEPEEIVIEEIKEELAVEKEESLKKKHKKHKENETNGV